MLATKKTGFQAPREPNKTYLWTGSSFSKFLMYSKLHLLSAKENMAETLSDPAEVTEFGSCKALSLIL